MNIASRLFSLFLMVAAWYVGSEIAGPRMLPGPQTVGAAMWAIASSAHVGGARPAETV